MSTATPATQDQTADEIRVLHAEVVHALQANLPKAIRIGKLLQAQKASLPHGAFTAWIEGNLPFTPRTARNYMRVFDIRDRLKTEMVSVLGKAYKLPEPGDAEQLNRISDEMADVVARARARLPELTLALATVTTIDEAHAIMEEAGAVGGRLGELRLRGDRIAGRILAEVERGRR
jgi:hypothetical protein